MVTSAPSDSSFHRGETDQWLVAATSCAVQANKAITVVAVQDQR